MPRRPQTRLRSDSDTLPARLGRGLGAAWARFGRTSGASGSPQERFGLASGELGG
jgi:hypothetical protein